MGRKCNTPAREGENLNQAGVNGKEEGVRVRDGSTDRTSVTCSMAE